MRGGSRIANIGRVALALCLPLLLGAKHALIISDDDHYEPIDTEFNVPVVPLTSESWHRNPLINSQRRGLESRGYGVEVIRPTPAKHLTPSKVLEDLREKAESLSSGDSLVVSLVCHGSRPLASGGHCCCLSTEVQCVDNTSGMLQAGPSCLDTRLVAEIGVIANARGARMAVIDNSCYGGATPRRPVPGTCLISTTSAGSVSYAGFGNFGAHLAGEGNRTFRDLVSSAQVSRLRQERNLGAYYGRINWNGCPDVVDIRESVYAGSTGLVRTELKNTRLLQYLGEVGADATYGQDGNVEYALSAQACEYRGSELTRVRDWLGEVSGASSRSAFEEAGRDHFQRIVRSYRRAGIPFPSTVGSATQAVSYLDTQLARTGQDRRRLEGMLGELNGLIELQEQGRATAEQVIRLQDLANESRELHLAIERRMVAISPVLSVVEDLSCRAQDNPDPCAEMEI